MSEKYLANENFPAGVAEWLRERGNDVAHAGQVLVGEPDLVILQTALTQDRVLLTFDQDFGQLVFRHRNPPAPRVVLFRLHPLSPVEMIANLETFFAGNPFLRGYFTVVSPSHFRQIALPEESS